MQLNQQECLASLAPIETFGKVSVLDDGNARLKIDVD